MTPSGCRGPFSYLYIPSPVRSRDLLLNRNGFESQKSISIAKHESRLPRWVFTNPDTPDGPIESLGIESLHELYREFLALVHEYKGLFVRTTEGRIQRKTWRGESSQESPDS